MKCFNHNQADAVGACKNCCKGICIECAVDLEDGLACKKNSCEQSVKRLNELLGKTKKIYQGNCGIYYKQAVMSGLSGGFFIVFGIWFQGPLAYFIIPLGIIFLLGMVFMILSGMKMKEVIKEE